MLLLPVPFSVLFCCFFCCFSVVLGAVSCGGAVACLLSFVWAVFVFSSVWCVYPLFSGMSFCGWGFSPFVLFGVSPVFCLWASIILTFSKKKRANSFGGRIPDTFGQLRNLKYLHLGRTNLSGTVPPSIFNISSLVVLFLSLNSLSGSLPLNIGFNLPNLETFVINNNDFTGMLPNSFSNASNIAQIDF